MAGEPAGLKITIHGQRDVRIGMVRHEPVSVALLDSFGNHLHIRPGQIDRISVTAPGLDESLVTKSLEVGGGFLQFWVKVKLCRKFQQIWL